MVAMGLRIGLTLMPFCPNPPRGWQKSFCISTTTSTLRKISSVMRCGCASSCTVLGLRGWRTRLTPTSSNVQALCATGPKEAVALGTVAVREVLCGFFTVQRVRTVHTSEQFGSLPNCEPCVAAAATHPAPFVHARAA